MEKIKVNMNPNPLDVQTIHASQNDGGAREWEFELHNNGELIDTSDVKEQLVFKAYKGGTEQILPENTSTPTTSPFLGDIRYPQGLLTDQEFTYRQSPAEEDGLARIDKIKGNTLAWNQLVQNGNFANISPWSINSDGTMAVANNEASITLTSVPSNSYTPNLRQATSNGFVQNHKYLFSFDVYLPHQSYMRVEFGGGGFGQNTDTQVSANTWQRVSIVKARDTAPTSNLLVFYPPYATGVWSANDVWKIRNVNVFDLTQMGLDITEPSDFTSLFPLSYYSYNQGSLLSFNGNGIKTVGKNLLNPSFTTINAYINGAGIVTTSSNDKGVIIPLLPNLDYVFKWNRSEILSATADDANAGLYSEYPSVGMQGTYIGKTNVSGGIIRFNSGSNKYAVIKLANITRTDYDLTIIGSQLEFGTSATSYEPYTSSTLSLPISTYFPNGMKSAYNSTDLTDIVRDELSQTKAIKKVKQITYDGSSDENWSSEPIGSGSASGQHNFYINVAPAKKLGLAMNNMAVPYALYTPNYIDGKINAYVSDGQNLNFYPGTDITSVADFRTWLSNHPLTVNIALPTDSYEETSFTTASLVTENAEIPLSNNDGVLLGKCTEQLSENPGFIDAKIKLTDSDGECYSNKIQLHIERSPQ